MIVIELSGLAAIARRARAGSRPRWSLVEAARRLRAAIESTDVPARLGENRFAVLTRRGAVRAHLLASRLLNALTAPYTAAGARSRTCPRAAGLAD